jgi:adenylate cyclase
MPVPAMPAQAWTPALPSLRKLRLVSGVVLFVYVAAHLINHALGLVSIAVAESGLRITAAIWQSPPGTLALYGAAGIHIALAFFALFHHRTLRMPPLELVRMVLGLGIPTLLIGHAVSTRLALEMYGHPTDYAHVVWNLWNSGREGLQLALLVPGWMHGCLGINFAFGRAAWFRRLRLPLLCAAVLLPVLAVLGFLAMVKEVSLLAQDPSWIATTLRELNPAQRTRLLDARDGLLRIYFCLIAVIVVARGVRGMVDKRRGSLISVSYPGRTVRVPRGWTVLEASRGHHIDHASACGGRARCASCRIRVTVGVDQCSPPSGEEQRTLAHIRAPEGTRLACQLRPRGDVSVVPLVSTILRTVRNPWPDCVEGQVAVMQVELYWERSHSLPIPGDLRYALNLFRETVGEATRDAGGILNRMMGDGVMVLFGPDVPAREANRRALFAAGELTSRLDTLHLELQQTLGCRTEHVIHLHTGLAAIGRRDNRVIPTVIAEGGAVDVARQLAACENRWTPGLEPGRIVASRATCVAAELDPEYLEWRERVLADGTQIDTARID